MRWAFPGTCFGVHFVVLLCFSALRVLSYPLPLLQTGAPTYSGNYHSSRRGSSELGKHDNERRNPSSLVAVAALLVRLTSYLGWGDAFVAAESCQFLDGRAPKYRPRAS